MPPLSSSSSRKALERAKLSNSPPNLDPRSSIGRVVRGNTIAIKEDGVSTKNLTIEWSTQGKWTVTDLDSSNGTFVNSSALPPLTTHDLRDGDVLKFGEVASIRVCISHFADSQPVGRSLRSRARVVGTGNSDDSESVVEGGNRRGRGRGRGGKDNFGLGMEVPDSTVSVDPEVIGKGRGRGRGRTRGKGNATIGYEGLGVEVSDSVVSVNSEVNVESSVGGGEGHGKKDGSLEDETELNPEISENVASITRKGGAVNNRRTRSSKKDVGGSVEKVEPVNSLRRLTRSRGAKNKDNSAFTSALERIPEASQVVGSVNCEGIPEASQLVGLRMDSAESVSVEEKGSEEEVIEGEQIWRESTLNAAEGDERLDSGLDLVFVKAEPQSNAGGIVSKGESVSKIVQSEGDLACKLNFVHEIGEDEEPECNIGGNVSQETAADATEKEAEAEIATDLNKMTLGEWFDHLERCLPKQIRAETDQIAQDMLKRLQQVHEFMLQK